MEDEMESLIPSPRSVRVASWLHQASAGMKDSDLLPVLPAANSEASLRTPFKGYSLIEGLGFRGIGLPES